MAAKTGVLVLVRHGQSTDNELNLFSGWRDPALTIQGRGEAAEAGRRLREMGLTFDLAVTSRLSRARGTLDLILAELGCADLPIVADAALNERDYGDLSGLNKEQARSTFGSEQVRLWRKSYEAVPPGGESLAMTAARTIPFYERAIAPRLRSGDRILVVAHGNSLRSIVKYLDGLSDGDIERANIKTGEIITYPVDEDGMVERRRSVSVGA